MREIDAKILQKKYIPVAFEIQKDTARFLEICKLKLEVAAKLVNELKSKNHPVRIVSQPNSPVVTINIDSTKFDEPGTPWSTFIVRLSKLVELGEIVSPRIVWGQGSLSKDLADRRNNEMHEFLEIFFDKTKYVEECSYEIPSDTPLFFDSKQFPEMNEEAFTPYGKFKYKNLFYSDLFDRFTLNELYDDFVDERLDTEFLYTIWGRKEVTLTLEQFQEEERQMNLGRKNLR
jgi:hypothetical protein